MLAYFEFSKVITNVSEITFVGSFSILGITPLHLFTTVKYSLMSSSYFNLHPYLLFVYIDFANYLFTVYLFVETEAK